MSLNVNFHVIEENVLIMMFVIVVTLLSLENIAMNINN